jgi:hypothetical protein
MFIFVNIERLYPISLMVEHYVYIVVAGVRFPHWVPIMKVKINQAPTMKIATKDAQLFLDNWAPHWVVRYKKDKWFSFWHTYRYFPTEKEARNCVIDIYEKGYVEI